MAKLGARGRKELFRVYREKVFPETERTIRERTWKALMSDGMILKRHVVWWNPVFLHAYDERSHDYGWTELGKIKTGMSARQQLDWYRTHEYTVESDHTAYLDPDKPMISEAKAAGAKRAKAKRTERSARDRDRKNGPGFYVTNGYTGSSMFGRTRIADHEEPFTTYEDAEKLAWRKLREFVSMRFDYLLPVLVIESPSREQAEGGGPFGEGTVWWIDGKYKGPPVDPRQLALFGQADNTIGISIGKRPSSFGVQFEVMLDQPTAKRLGGNLRATGLSQDSAVQDFLDRLNLQTGSNFTPDNIANVIEIG